MNKLRNKTTFSRDNRGSAIVMVLVAIAFVGILASMLMYVTFTNFRTKILDRYAKDNFYTAETAMNEIKAGLQQYVSEAFSSAYIQALQEYGTNTSDASRQQTFSLSYKERLMNELEESSGSSTYKLSLLQGFVTHPYDTSTQTGAAVTSENGQQLLSYQDGVRLKGVTVTYTNEQGYVAIITTDIVLKVPELDMGSATEIPEVTDYCIIANEKTLVESGSNTINASIYGGKQGMELTAGTSLVVAPYVDGSGSSRAVKAITDGIISVGQPKGGAATAGSAQFTMDEGTTLWASGITVNGGSGKGSSVYNLQLKGTSYIQDDLTIAEKGSRVKVEGSYYGYGDKTNQALDSSAILINGPDTTLDMSGVSDLVLAGSAYIGTSQLENDEEENKDVKMGSSVSSKAEQLAFLVPSECIGYNTATQTTVLGRNPVNVNDTLYQDFMAKMKDDPDTYKEVNLDLVNSTLKKALSSYGATFEKVYYQPDSSNLWVYYYLKFDATANANKFFQDYFTAAPQKLTPYIANYVSALSIPALDSASFNMNLAGNMITVTPGAAADGSDTQYNMVTATVAQSLEEQVTQNKANTQYANQFIGLCKKLTEDYASLTGKERNSDVYTNIIDEDQVKKYANLETTFTHSSGVKAMLITSNELVKSDIRLSDIPAEVHLIVTDRNVIADRDFSGLIISKETITIQGGVTLSIFENIGDCFLAEANDVNGNTTRAISLFKDGVDGTLEESSDDAEAITAENLVAYENWTKK